MGFNSVAKGSIRYFVCVLYMFEASLPENNLKKIDTCRSISGYMKMCTDSTCGFVGIMY